MPFDGIVRTYDKNMNLIAMFDGRGDVDNDEAKRNQMVAPTVHRETNGESILTFQMLANSEKWETIKDPENIYELNDHYYTALNDGSYEFTGEDNVRIVNVKLVETWYLLDKKFVQAYNCGIYCYAKATFSGYTTDGAIFTIKSTDCSSPSNAISSALAWNQVKNWTPTDDNGNNLTYAVLTSDEYKPTKWDDAPAGVQMSSFTVSGNTATAVIKGRLKSKAQKNFSYSGKTYMLGVNPTPGGVDGVYINVTTETTSSTGSSTNGQTYTSYATSTKQVPFSYSNGVVTLNYNAAPGETINSVIVNYGYYELGSISSGATCVLAYGAEVVDEHTFVILPKAKAKYKLTIDGVEYNDSDVKDSRGVVMPRGSGGYALWAALRNTGWSLGVCDVIAKGFDTSIDYGCFNVESDMKDVLYIIQYIQELYGGILDFDSKNKVVNYRAENSDDYQSYNDGFNEWTGYEFREGKNMTDQPQITWDNELVTRGYPIGYGNLNIKKVNNGKTYIDDFSYTNKVYEGYLEQPLIYDTRDAGGMTQLLYWGKRELAKKCRPRVKISANVTDIRTVEGYEHEVFDLNNVVRCYYKDSETGEETYEEKRITLWEYNAFAMWDCDVEMGDKTQNLVDVFKLIYNMAIDQAPSVNASGQISHTNVTGIDEMIYEATTENSKAIADIIIMTNDLYAQIDLFAQYQKVTETMISNTSANLTLYADEKMSALELVVRGNYEELDAEIGTLRTQTEAGFVAQQTQNNAFSNQFASIESTIIDINGKIQTQSKALADFTAEVGTYYAKTSNIASYVNNAYNDGKLTSITNAIGGVKTYADKNFVATTTFSEFFTKEDGKEIKSLSELITYVDSKSAYASLAAKIDGYDSFLELGTDWLGNPSHAELAVLSSGKEAKISMYPADIAIIATSSNPSTLSNSSMITLSGDRVFLYARKFLHLINKYASWKQLKIDDTTITYLSGSDSP